MNLRQMLSYGVEYVIAAASRLLDPVMPWLFLALRRALLATLVTVIVAVLFFVVPQSQEVLRGLGEPLLKSMQDFNDETAKQINFWAYLFYVISAVALGLATWYAARLLSTVETQGATPRHLATDIGAERLQRATTWLPRGLGVFVLGAAIGALIYASYTPGLSQWQALGLVVLAIGGPLLAAVGVLGGPLAVRWCGIVAALAGAALLMGFAPKWRIALACILSSTLPAALLWFLVKRRLGLARLGWNGAVQPYDERQFGQVFVTLFSIVAAGVALLLLLGFMPAQSVRLVGSAATVLWFLAAAALFLTGVQIVVRRASYSVPGLTPALLITATAAIATVGHESLGHEEFAPAADVAATPSQRAEPAIAKAKYLYVNAHGGGLRAALFTAQTLALADDSSCGRFGQHIAASSGVSGGSLGIATYLIARQEHMRHGGWSNCTPGAPATVTPLTDIVIRALVQDHLSPTIARMLAVDVPHLPKVSPARGQALLESWQSALATSLAEADAAGSNDPPVAFALHLGALTGGLTPPPLVYFNATDADSGHIVWFSNRQGGQVLSGAETVNAPDITVAQAVLHSARFPIVSPAGAWGSQRLVDGGYADNSGAITLLRVLLDDKPHGDATPMLINIDGNPPGDPECKSTHGDATPTRIPSEIHPASGSGECERPPVVTALRALLQARTAHAARAVREFTKSVGGRTVHVALDLEKALADPKQGDPSAQLRRARHAPLGWYVSYTAAKTMEASTKQGAIRICAATGDACGPESQAALRRP